MFNKLNNKKVALWLFVAALFCFAIAAVLLYQIDVKGMSRVDSEFTIDEEETFGDGEVNKVILNTFSSNINIISTNDNVIKVHVYGKAVVQNESDKPQPEIKLEKGTIYATDNKNTSQNRKVQLFTFDIGSVKSDIVMDVYLPSNFEKELNAETSSGIINFGDLALSNLSINTFSGDVKAGSLSSGKAVFESSSGRIAVQKITADNIKVNSFSGDINFDSIKTKSAYFDSSSGKGVLGDINSETFKFVTFSGDIDVNTLISEDSDISSSSGDIHIKDGKINKMKLKTFSGSITGENTGAKDTNVDTSSGKVFVTGLAGKLTVQSFSGDAEAGFVSNPNDIFVKSSSGKVKLTLPPDASFRLDAHSSSGRIKCDFPVQMSGNGDDNSISGTVGSDEGKVNIETFSGSIDIER